MNRAKIISKISIVLIILIIVFTVIQKLTNNYIASFHVHYLSMINTSDIDKFYPEMNQVEASIIDVLEAPKRILIKLNTNTLNFNHYEIIADDKKKMFLKTESSQIEQLLHEGVNILEIYAVDKLGERSRPCKIEIVASGYVHYLKRFDNGQITVRNPSFWMFGMESSNVDSENWLRGEVSPFIKNLKSDLDKYIAIREWAANQASASGSHKLIKGGDSPWVLIKKLRQGDAARCAIMARTYIGVVNSVGLIAREVALWRYYPLIKGLVPNGHNVSEVWVKELNKWVLMDPTYNAYFTIDGLPASALELHKVLAKRTPKVKVIQSGDLTWLFNKKYTQDEIKALVRSGTIGGIVGECVAGSLKVGPTDYSSYLSYFKHLFLPIDSRHWKKWSKDELPITMEIASVLANVSKKIFFGWNFFAKQFRQLYNHLSLLYVKPRYLHWVDDTSPVIADSRRQAVIFSICVHTITFVLWATLLPIVVFLLIKTAIRVFAKKGQLVK